MPIIVTPDKLISEVAVIVFRMLSSSRSTPAAKIDFFALLRVVTLHDAHAAKRFRQPPGDFRVNLRPRAKNRPNRLERPADPDCQNSNTMPNATLVILTLVCSR